MQHYKKRGRGGRRGRGGGGGQGGQGGGQGGNILHPIFLVCEVNEVLGTRRLGLKYKSPICVCEYVCLCV